MSILGPRVRVQSVEPRDRFRAFIVFDNGTQREVDLEPLLHGPIFESIRNNQTLFRSMEVTGGTIAWENGADIDPDVLYYNLTPAWMDIAEPVIA